MPCRSLAALLPGGCSVLLVNTVAHFTSELPGGAGVAAQRLHAALRAQGIASRLFFGAGTATLEDCVQYQPNKSFFWRNVAAVVLSWHNRQCHLAHGLFTWPQWIRRTPMSCFGPIPDIVNLHWVSRWLDLPSFFASLPASLPVVWSLHDMNPLTGGCHYALDCDRFVTHCCVCPHLRSPTCRDHSYRIFKLKSRLYSGVSLHLVGNSEWTTIQARKSALMCHAKSVQTIPLGLDIQEYVPIDKVIARQALGLATGPFVLGFSCADFADRRKGTATLMEALNGLARELPLTLLAVGAGRLPPLNPNVQVIALGSLTSPRLQSLFYSAVDVFVNPSRIESFGLTALEALACGTPVIAYKTGGLPEVVSDGETGLLESEIGSAAGLARHIEWFITHPQERQLMGHAARARVEKLFSAELMARRYLQLYESLVNR